MPEVRVQDEQGNIHVFPDGSTPEMISQAMGLQPGQAPQPKMYNPQRSPMDLIASAAGPAYALAGNPDVREFGKQMLQKATDPSTLFGATGLGMMVNQGKQLYGMATKPAQPPSLAAAAGAVGVDPESVKRNAETQNYPGLAADVAFPVLSMEATKRIGAAPSPSELFQQMRPKGAQSLMYPQAASLPPTAVNAAEGIFQAAAPTGTNTNFRQALYTALPDLAEVARKVNLNEMKGGIINPDMRVGATVKAIDAHLKDMYATERAPQIQAHANESVQLSLDPNTRRGLEYLSNHAGLAEEQALAAQALKTGKLSVAATDQLAKTANQYLLKYEGGTPEAQAQMEATSPKVGGLKALDRSVGNSLNSVLEADGEPGLRGYEQRYAALSRVRDGLRPRINATELERNLDLGMVGKGIKAVTGGKSGIVSASQAAVADVNIGKTLQKSMQTLAESDLQPKRAIRQASPTSIQPLPGQSQ